MHRATRRSLIRHYTGSYCHAPLHVNPVHRRACFQKQRFLPYDSFPSANSFSQRRLNVQSVINYLAEHFSVERSQNVTNTYVEMLPQRQNLMSPCTRRVRHERYLSLHTFSAKAFRSMLSNSIRNHLVKSFSPCAAPSRTLSTDHHSTSCTSDLSTIGLP